MWTSPRQPSKRDLVEQCFVVGELDLFDVLAIKKAARLVEVDDGEKRVPSKTIGPIASGNEQNRPERKNDGRKAEDEPQVEDVLCAAGDAAQMMRS